MPAPQKQPIYLCFWISKLWLWLAHHGPLPVLANISLRDFQKELKITRHACRRHKTYWLEVSQFFVFFFSFTASLKDLSCTTGGPLEKTEAEMVLLISTWLCVCEHTKDRGAPLELISWNDNLSFHVLINSFSSEGPIHIVKKYSYLIQPISA